MPTGRQPYRENTFARLRVLARQAALYHHKLRSLPPVYDYCPSRCVAPERDIREGCPDCPVTRAYQDFKRAYATQLEYDLKQELERTGELSTEEVERLAAIRIREGSPFDDLIGEFNYLLELEDFAGGEDNYSPLWNIKTVTAIRYIRAERFRVRREIRYEEDEEDKAKERADRIRRGHVTGE